MRLRIHPIILVWALVLSPVAGAVQNWKVGLAKKSITPERPTALAGYSERTAPSSGVRQTIWVKALALEDDVGGRAVMITADFIGFRAPVAEEICKRIMNRTGLGRAQILINASHTHNGPGQFLPGMAPPGEGLTQALEEYTQWMIQTVADTALAALTDMHPAVLDYTTGFVGFPVNRRQHSPRGVILGFNPRGAVDRSVPLLRVRSPEGKLLALMFGAACHNTSLPRKDTLIAGDYSGVAQALTEQNFPGVQAMFVQGCGGDTTPYPTGSANLTEAHGNELASEVSFLVQHGKFQTIGGPLQVRLAHTNLPLEKAPDLPAIKALLASPSPWKRKAGQQLMAEHRASSKPATHYRAPLAVWQFGRDLTFIGLPGEPVADYVIAIERTLGPLNLWIAGYCNDVFGYLPTPRILAEGGYESRGLYSGRRFSPEVLKVLLKDLRTVAADAGRPMPRINGVPHKKQ